LLVLEANSEPQENCAVCRTRNNGLKIDIHHTTLQSLLKNVVTASTADGGLGMSEEVTILEGDRYCYNVHKALNINQMSNTSLVLRLLYDIEFDDNVEKTLDALALEDGKILNIKDDEVDDDTGVNLVLQHA
jgi:ubiquitin-like 1-activating enzyme E1 B